MRKFLLAVLGLMVLVLAAGGWWAGTRLFRDPLKQAEALAARGELRGASLELRTLLRRHPENAVAHARLGEVQLVLGDATAAERELLAARAGGYHGTNLTPLLARAVLAQGRAKEVLANYASTGLPPEDAAAVLVVRGLALLSLGELDAARASAEAAGRLAPKLASPPLLEAQLALRRGQPGEALVDIDHALAIDGKLIDALLFKAQVLRALGRNEAALAVLDSAVAAVPDAAPARLARIEALIADNQDASARDDVEALLKRKSATSSALYFKALLLIRARDWAGADAALQASKLEPSRIPRGDYYLALIKSNLGQPEQALNAITRYVAHAPGDADGVRLLARIDLQTGRKQEAAAALARLSSATTTPPEGEDPATPRALTHLASIELGEGNADGAQHALAQSLETIPTIADIERQKLVVALRLGEVDEAAAALARLEKTPKVDPATLAALTGAVRLAQLDLDGAVQSWEAALKQVPDSASLRVDIARVLALRGQVDAALDTLAPVLAKDPANPTALGTYVDLQIAAGHADRAATAIEAARAVQPGAERLLLALAVLQARGGDLPAAIATLGKIKGDVARAPQVQAMRARFLLAQGHADQAITTYEQILHDAPQDAGLRRQLVELLLARGKDAPEAGQRAVQLAREGLQQAPGNTAMQQLLVGAVYRVSGLDAALAEAAALRAQPANLPTAQLLKGQIYMAAGRPADAAAAFAAEMGEAPFTTLVMEQALALRTAGRADEASTLLSSWVAQMPDPAAVRMLGELALEAKRLDDAAKAFGEVLVSRPGDTAALNNLAWIYQQQHDPRAMALARKAYLLAPGGQTADTLGWILLEDGRKDLALILLRQAAAQRPGDPAIVYHLAVAFKETGKDAQARALLASLLKSDAKFEEREPARRLAEELSAATDAK